MSFYRFTNDFCRSCPDCEQSDFLKELSIRPNCADGFYYPRLDPHARPTGPPSPTRGSGGDLNLNIEIIFELEDALREAEIIRALGRVPAGPASRLASETVSADRDDLEVGIGPASAPDLIYETVQEVEINAELDLEVMSEPVAQKPNLPDGLISSPLSDAEFEARIRSWTQDLEHIGTGPEDEVGPEAQDATQSHCADEVESRSQLSAFFDVQKGTPVEAEPDTEPETQSELQQQVQLYILPAAQQALQPEGHPELQADIEAEAQPDDQTEVQPESQPEAQADVKTEAQSEVQPEIQVAMEAEAQHEEQTEVQQVCQLEAQSEPERDSAPEIQVVLGPEPQSNSISENQTQVFAGVEKELSPFSKNGNGMASDTSPGRRIRNKSYLMRTGSLGWTIYRR